MHCCEESHLHPSGHLSPDGATHSLSPFNVDWPLQLPHFVGSAWSQVAQSVGPVPILHWSPDKNIINIYIN